MEKCKTCKLINECDFDLTEGEDCEVIKLLAEPIFNKKLKKWTIEVEIEGQKILLGHSVNVIFMEYEKYDTKEQAIDYINSDSRLILRELEGISAASIILMGGNGTNLPKESKISVTEYAETVLNLENKRSKENE